MPVANVSVVLDDVSLTSLVQSKLMQLVLNQMTDPVALVSTATLGRVVNGSITLGEATLVATTTLGSRPDVIVLSPKLYNLTGPVRDSGGAILCFQGPPWKTVEWRMVQGTGTLTPFTSYTDELGRASCRFDPGYHGYHTTVVVGVAYVP